MKNETTRCRFTAPGFEGVGYGRLKEGGLERASH